MTEEGKEQDVDADWNVKSRGASAWQRRETEAGTSLQLERERSKKNDYKRLQETSAN
jgi:hypothetical protein